MQTKEKLIETILTQEGIRIVCESPYEIELLDEEGNIIGNADGEIAKEYVRIIINKYIPDYL